MKFRASFAAARRRSARARGLLRARGSTRTRPTGPRAMSSWRREQLHVVSVADDPDGDDRVGRRPDGLLGRSHEGFLCHDISATNGIDNVGFLQIPNSRRRSRSSWRVGQFDETTRRVSAISHTQAPGDVRDALAVQARRRPSIPRPTTSTAAQTSTYMLLFSTGTTPGSGASRCCSSSRRHRRPTRWSPRPPAAATS